jgi:acyl-CoA dehydrogenase
MDFTLAPEVDAFRLRVREFVAEHVLPLESDADTWGEGENVRDEVLHPLRVRARDAGLWCPQMPRERGGQGFGAVAMAACYEEMNRSLFGPAVFNCAPPDDGNMMVLEKVATFEQKARWLQPIVDGEVRSALAMTEPHPGAGSDPAGMMRSTAIRAGDKWIIDGHKWFITGAGVAQTFIVDRVPLRSRRSRVGDRAPRRHHGAGRARRALRAALRRPRDPR